MQTRLLKIANPRGLHARACARIVAIAKSCRCNLFLVRNGRRASARNIVAVMMMTATIGATVRASRPKGPTKRGDPGRSPRCSATASERG
ncbi:MAG: HPr family phosphocarrier protein [Comamonadaceae bacterium]|nr:HPr family phosphocarrier protein [Comamonadaceae bacterium]